MRLGKAAKLLGEHHSAQRPAMAPPAGRNDPYDRRGVTAAWASANRLPKSYVDQLFAGTLPGPQFRIVKEAERAAKAASRDGLLDSRKREALVASIKKAPPAEPTRSARVAGSSSAPRGRSRGPSAASAAPDTSSARIQALEKELAAAKKTARARTRTPSAARGRSRQPETHQPEPKPATEEGEYVEYSRRRRRKSRGQRSRRTADATAAARADPAHAESKPASPTTSLSEGTTVVIEVLPGEEASASGWMCPHCGAQHRSATVSGCRICWLPKVEPAPPAAQPAQSLSALTAKLEELSAHKLCMDADNIACPGLDERIADLRRQISGPTASPPVDPFKLLQQRRDEEALADARVLKMTNQRNLYQHRLVLATANAAAGLKALAHAEKAQLDARLAVTAAHVSCPVTAKPTDTGPSGPEGPPAQASSAVPVALAAELSTFRHMTGQAAEAKFQEYLTNHKDGPPLSPVEYVLREAQAFVHKLVGGQAVASETPVGAAGADRAPRAGSQPREAGNDGSRIAPRPAKKADSIDATASNATVEAGKQMEAQRKETRDAALNVGRDPGQTLG